MLSSIKRRMYMVLIITVLAACSGVLITVYAVIYNETMAQLRETAYEVRDYIVDSVLFTVDLSNISDESEIGDAARRQAGERLDLLLYAGNIRHLYFAAESESGNMITTLKIQNPDGTYTQYMPTGALYADLRRSFDEGVAISGSWMSLTEHGRTYSIFWPLMVNMDSPIAVVGIEFDVDSTYQTLRNIVVYSLAFSIILIGLVLVIAYLLMSRTSEPFYKKMAYLDFLTGIENRLAYEQRLVHCEELVSKGVSVTIVIFDVNNLKTINDTLGHKQGDSYITNTAKTISEHIGSMGNTYRIGGDEFAAVLVDQEQSDVDKLLDNLRSEKRQVLHNTPFDCALGAATFTPGIDAGLNDLANRADQEMYKAKRRAKR